MLHSTGANCLILSTCELIIDLQKFVTMYFISFLCLTVWFSVLYATELAVSETAVK